MRQSALLVAAKVPKANGLPQHSLPRRGVGHHKAFPSLALQHCGMDVPQSTPTSCDATGSCGILCGVLRRPLTRPVAASHIFPAGAQAWPFQRRESVTMIGLHRGYLFRSRAQISDKFSAYSSKGTCWRGHRSSTRRHSRPKDDNDYGVRAGVKMLSKTWMQAPSCVVPRESTHDDIQPRMQ